MRTIYTRQSKFLNLSCVNKFNFLKQQLVSGYKPGRAFAQMIKKKWSAALNNLILENVTKFHHLPFYTRLNYVH